MYRVSLWVCVYIISSYSISNVKIYGLLFVNGLNFIRSLYSTLLYQSYISEPIFSTIGRSDSILTAGTFQKAFKENVYFVTHFL